VRWITAIGGFLGCTAGFALCIYSVVSWPLVVGGKELISIPPFVVIAYESMILLGALSNLIGMLALARLPQVKAPAPYDPRFTEDRIGVWVPGSGDAAERCARADARPRRGGGHTPCLRLFSRWASCSCGAARPCSAAART
jgi:hypothetical protein